MASTPAAGHARYAIDNGVDFSNLDQTAERHGVIVLKSGHAAQMRRIKATRPGVKVLVYKNLTFTSSSWTAPAASGVLYSEAVTQPDWFLRDGAGRLISSSGYGYLTAMDVGHPGYQQRWADNVLTEMQSEGWDGVFLDDVNPTMKYHVDPARIVKYPNDTAWTEATRRALASVATRIRGSGKLAVANIGTWHEDFGTGKAWLQYLSGAMQENFVKWGTSMTDGYVWDWPNTGWGTMLEMVRETERQGKLFLGVTHSQNGDARAARYGWGTVLLAGGGHSYFALHGDYAKENWFPEYDYDLGRPYGAASKSSGGVWRRQFERGLVLVNPTNGARSVDFGGSYSGSGLPTATQASMAATSALILKKEGGGQPPPANEPRSMSLLVAASGPQTVELSWTRPRRPRGVRRYRVYRDGRPLKTTSRRSFRDSKLASGSIHRYSVAALRRGKVVRRSRAVSVRAGASVRLASSGKSRRHLLRAWLAPARSKLWRRAHVEQLVRVKGRRVWRRISRSRRVRRSTALWVRASSRSMVVRVVVRAKGRRVAKLRSRPFRV